MDYIIAVQLLDGRWEYVYDYDHRVLRTTPNKNNAWTFMFDDAQAVINSHVSWLSNNTSEVRIDHRD